MKLFEFEAKNILKAQGITVPAGAIIMGNKGTAKSKIYAFAAAGVPVAEKPSDIARFLKGHGF